MTLRQEGRSDTVGSMQHNSPNPFLGIPPALSANLRPHLPAVSADVVRAIHRAVPAYGGINDPGITHRLRHGVEMALRIFLDRIAHPQSRSAAADLTSVYRRLGAMEAAAGRSLDALQAALRVGARSAWHSMLERIDKARVPQAVIADAAEAMLVHMEQIGDAARSGYLKGEGRQRETPARERLAGLLIADPPPSPEAVRVLARASRWEFPKSIGVVALGPDTSGRPLILPPDMLVGGPTCVIVPDPTSRERRNTIQRALHGRSAAIGPASSVTDGFRSLQWATDALLLSRRGIIPGTGLIVCADHLATLLMFRDEKLLELLSRRHLEPLMQVTGQHRDKLAATLLVWLQSGNNAITVAERLDVHPQTARYRMRQLRRLYGDALLDPDVQFELKLALRARVLQRTAGAAS